MLALLLVGLIVAGCGDDDSKAGAEATTESATTAGERAGHTGVSVALPDGWSTTTWDDGIVTDPLTRIVVASAPVRQKATPCQVAKYDFAADAVALVVVEWSEALRPLPARPARFTSSDLPVHPPPAIECFEGSGGSAHFLDHGRTFGAYLLVGPRAPAALADEARRVLDTLEVTRRGDARPQRLARNGISVAVPDGWDGRLFFREATGRDGVIFQVASFPLPANEGLEPPTRATARRAGPDQGDG